jgi:hypothetical protein
LEILLDVHRIGSWIAVVANAAVGLLALAAWQWRPFRGRWLWIATIAAEVLLLAQVVVGSVLLSSDDYEIDDIHAFYGFVAFLTVGLAYGYRRSMRGRLEMFYGLVGLFLMGLGIRAMTQVT